MPSVNSEGIDSRIHFSSSSETGSSAYLLKWNPAQTTLVNGIRCLVESATSGTKRSWDQFSDSQQSLCAGVAATHLQEHIVPQEPETYSATGMHAARAPTMEFEESAAASMAATANTQAMVVGSISQNVNPAEVLPQNMRPGQVPTTDLVVSERAIANTREVAAGSVARPKKARRKGGGVQAAESRNDQGAPGPKMEAASAEGAVAIVNDDDEQWQGRLDKRVQWLATFKASDLYPGAALVGDLQEPDPYDRKCSKKKWDERTRIWKSSLRQLAEAAP